MDLPTFYKDPEREAQREERKRQRAQHEQLDEGIRTRTQMPMGADGGFAPRTQMSTHAARRCVPASSGVAGEQDERLLQERDLVTLFGTFQDKEGHFKKGWAMLKVKSVHDRASYETAWTKYRTSMHKFLVNAELRRGDLDDEEVPPVTEAELDDATSYREIQKEVQYRDTKGSSTGFPYPPSFMKAASWISFGGKPSPGRGKNASFKVLYDMSQRGIVFLRTGEQDIQLGYGAASTRGGGSPSNHGILSTAASAHQSVDTSVDTSMLQQLLRQDPGESTFKVSHSARCFPPWFNRSGFDVDYSREDLARDDGDWDDDGDMGGDSRASSAAHLDSSSRDQVDHDDDFRLENMKLLLEGIPTADATAIMNDKRLGPSFVAYW